MFAVYKHYKKKAILWLPLAIIKWEKWSGNEKNDKHTDGLDRLQKWSLITFTGGLGGHKVRRHDCFNLLSA
jgi:hypothetical protein